MQKYFGIMQADTGLLLPLTKQRSWAEFGDKGFPRLYATQQGAQRALKAWLKGPWTLPTHTEDDAFGNGYTVNGIPEVLDTPKAREIAAKRQALNVRVVELTIAVKVL